MTADDSKSGREPALQDDAVRAEAGENGGELREIEHLVADAPASVRAGAEVIRDFWKTLPNSPGVYRMIDASGFIGEGSPDRADALVWALSELMLSRRGEPRVRLV